MGGPRYTEDERLLISQMYHCTTDKLSESECKVITQALYELSGRRVTARTIRTRIHRMGLHHRLPKELRGASPIRDNDQIRGFIRTFKVKFARERPCDKEGERWLEIL